MNINISSPIKQIMTRDLVFVGPNALMTEIDTIFKTHEFHHIPVIDEKNRAIGIISKSDYFQLQHHFTKMDFGKSEEFNKKLFSSLLASEVMTRNPVCVDKEKPIREIIELFLENMFHAVLVEDAHQCLGIVTTHDILKFVYLSTDVKSISVSN